jgi:putative transposase
MQVMAAMFDEDATWLCGPQGRHNPGRGGYRHGSEAGSVTLGGRRLPVTRPRVRAADGSGELHLPSYDLFSSTEVLGRMAMEKMLAGLSSRRYGRGLEPAGQAVEQAAAATSKSAVSRRFVAATETALEQLMSRRLDDLDLVALMVDGVHFGEHSCVVALGIDIEGVKHPLAIEEGSTENATLVTDLATGLRERGLDVTRPILAVLDGARALSRAVKDVFDKPLIERCQQHKIKNVRDKLPERLRTVAERRMRQAYHAASAVEAEGQLTALARELDKTHPGAAASLREGMAETLTILRLGVPPTLARTLRSPTPSSR